MPRFFVLTLVFLCLARPALAQGPGSVYLEDLTWTELATQVRSGKTTVIIPVGGVEQSGPAMALGKHDARVKVLAGRIAAALGNAVVAPVVAYVPEGGLDPPTEHMRFPGTITIPVDAFRATLDSAARSLALHGFTDIVLLGDHGGYQKDLALVAARLNESWAKGPARAHYIAQYYGATQGAYVAALRSRGYGVAEIGTHAGLADTSLMLAVDPRLVRQAQLKTGRFTPAEGVHGDPRRSNAALGVLGTNQIIAQSVAAIRADLAESAARRRPVR